MKITYFSLLGVMSSVGIYYFASMLKDELALIGGGNTADLAGTDLLYRTEAVDDFAEISAANNTMNAPASASVSTIIYSSLGVAVAIALLVVGIMGIVQTVNRYNVTYTEIPTNMVDTVETVNGNRYVNYQVVNSLYKDGDKTAEKPGDTNGYDGKQWNALYFTKSYEAGKCMTANGYFIDSASNFGKYTPVAKFGATNCYDLNAYNGNKNGDSIFIAFGNSNNKKTAATAVPTVIGSIFANGGAMAISGVAGLGVGMALMAVVKRKKPKSEENNEVA
jgi:hypothetical protein